MSFLGNRFADVRNTAHQGYELHALVLGELFPRIYLHAYQDRVDVPEQVCLFLNDKHIAAIETKSNMEIIAHFLKTSGNELTCVIDSLPSSVKARKLVEKLEKFPNAKLFIRPFNKEYSFALHCDRCFFFTPPRLFGVSIASVGDSADTYNHIKKVWGVIQTHIRPISALEMQLT